MFNIAAAAAAAAFVVLEYVIISVISGGWLWATVAF